VVRELKVELRMILLMVPQRKQVVLELRMHVKEQQVLGL
jgi:hypothetical protein